MPSYKSLEGTQLSPQELLQLTAARYPHKFEWFMSHGYMPHYWQSLFHAMENAERDRLCHYRILAAGRKGGKTMSAAWEVLYYALHPGQFHWDTKRQQSDKPLWVHVLCKTQKVGTASWRMFQEALTEAGLKANVDYKLNRAERTVEFPNGSLIEWKTAVDPQSLRGPGLDILWLDEAAFITSDEAYNVIHPALMQKLGTVLCTTTPDGKNWFYEEFWGKDKQHLDDPDIGRVEYRSIDNPYFPREAWEREKIRMHPLMFKQEYEASFDAMVGKELPGEWLTKWFYEWDDLPKKDDGKRLDLDIYIGIDPAISLADTADKFALAVIGVEKDHSTVYVLDVVTSRLSFAEQLDLIRQYHQRWKPILMGIEAVAYQRALAEMVTRMDSLPPVVPMLARGHKWERILAMSPLFRVGRVRTRNNQADFIDEWLNYDSQLKNPNDDCLDAVEIALRTAGALMPDAPVIEKDDFFGERPLTMDELVKRDRQFLGKNRDMIDEHLGSMI